MKSRSSGMVSDSTKRRWRSRWHSFFHKLWRRKSWFLKNVGFGSLANTALAAVEFALKRKKMRSWPSLLKIDISPLCNLRCTVCVHAYPNGNKELENQKFRPDQKMTLEQYRKIINEIKGKSCAVSLYYLGDPFMHPNLDEMCRIARNAHLNVHVSTNLNFTLTDDRIRQIVKSGLTHLTVCIDGMSQEKYQLTRIGGRIDRVLSNLKLLCECKKNCSQVYPKIEVQYIKFQHNLVELKESIRFCKEIGVDEFTHFWGDLCNYTDYNVELNDPTIPKKQKRFPLCVQPYFDMLIKYNGDVIPCCNYRQGAQYSEAYDPRVLGNVFESGVRDVWNSPEYCSIRRLVINPELVETEPSLRDKFCYGCGNVCTPVRKRNICRSARRYKFEEVYTIDKKGVPLRLAK